MSNKEVDEQKKKFRRKLICEINGYKIFKGNSEFIGPIWDNKRFTKTGKTRKMVFLSKMYDVLDKITKEDIPPKTLRKIRKAMVKMIDYSEEVASGAVSFENMTNARNYGLGVSDVIRAINYLLLDKKSRKKVRKTVIERMIDEEE